MRVRFSCLGSGLLVTCLLAAALAGCGGDDKKDPSVSNTPDDAGDKGGNGGHGGKPGGGKSGTGGGDVDAGKDAGTDATMPFPTYDAYIPPTDAAHDPPPAEWVCPAAFWDDGTCDCSCGALDKYDCSGGFCTTPGCVAGGCQACFTEQFAWKKCEEPEDLANATCVEGEMNDAYCDCGCGVQDPACKNRGCKEPGCAAEGCFFRHDARKATDTDDDGTIEPSENTRLGASPPSAWTQSCAAEKWGSGDGCDCGCGAHDPDCPIGISDCLSPNCNAPECDNCNDGKGHRVACNTAISTAMWTCDSYRYGDGDLLDHKCDCGCGVADPDCAPGTGCSGFNCRPAKAGECNLCTDSTKSNNDLVGCTPKAPATLWQCDAKHYGTNDGCDCGCGAHDPDCGDAANGCETSGCQDDGMCDYCHDGPLDVLSDYVQCLPAGKPGWSCGDETGDAWSSGDVCDCGCTKPDPACRFEERQGCTALGCDVPVCEYCTGATGRAACTGPRWSLQKGCDAKAYGDGTCDCGCGGIDKDCEAGKGCSGPSCAENGCELCHDVGLIVGCKDWTCDADAYDDGVTCDCGCGAPDPDCMSKGCIEPGCNTPMCQTCHDPKGRATPECP